jgi:esterase/lipase superfamily enzyme
MFKHLWTIIVLALLHGLTGCALPSSSLTGPASTWKGYAAPATPDAQLSDGPTTTERNYPVLYGTSRKPAASGVGFSEERDSRVNYGRVWVNIPKGHHTGSLGTRTIWPWSTDTELTVRTFDQFANEAEFLALARRELTPVTTTENGYLLIFIHGYNNSFEDAAIRAAQLGFDLNVPDNNMMFFSWAAQHSIPKYTFDEATVDASEVYLREFLNTAMKASGGRKVHVIAHSMGNRAFLRTVLSSLNQSSNEQHMKFGQIILAAADLDSDLFAQLAPAYLRVSDRTTVYLSPYDYAVRLSDRIHDYSRVGCGDAPQVDVKGIDNVVSFIKQDIPAHAYFAEALPVLTDIKNLIIKNQPSRSSNEWVKRAGYWTVGTSPSAGTILCTTTKTIRVIPSIN